MEENKGYPRFQYSIFLNGREEQLVIRADSWGEFLEAKKEADKIIRKRKKNAGEGNSDSQKSKKCEICGSYMNYKEGFKNNRQWKAWFCESGNREHTVWVD